MIIYDNQRLKIEQDSDRLFLSGTIDEFFLFNEVKGSIFQNMILDLKGLLKINSCGVRELITWMNSLPPETKTEYINCPIFFVQQANMVNGIVSEKRMIKTFFAPYFNEATEQEHEILLKIEAVQNMKAPARSELVFDSIENKYFNFLNFQRA